VQDASLIASIDVASGIKSGGKILINTAKTPEKLGLSCSVEVKTIDATKLALDVMGKPIVNTVLLGAIARFGVVSLDSVVGAIGEKFSGKVRDMNIKAAKKAYRVI
jgi:pyruvate ferredoxin oxidoreductase gamma subunit